MPLIESHEIWFPLHQEYSRLTVTAWNHIYDVKSSPSETPRETWKCYHCHLGGTLPHFRLPPFHLNGDFPKLGLLRL